MGWIGKFEEKKYNKKNICVEASSLGNPEMYNVKYERRKRNRISVLNILSHNSFLNRNKSL